MEYRRTWSEINPFKVGAFIGLTIILIGLCLWSPIGDVLLLFGFFLELYCVVILRLQQK